MGSVTNFNDFMPKNGLHFQSVKIHDFLSLKNYVKSILRILDEQNDEKILKFPHRNLSLLYVRYLVHPI